MTWAIRVRRDATGFYRESRGLLMAQRLGTREYAEEIVRAMPNGAEFEVVEESGPKWTDLIGIDPDYTEGKPVGEWLDEQRGEA